jgi:hypothetical protein
MTAKRLEELRKKFNSGSGTIQDVGEILVELFQSVSTHMKELKGIAKDQNSNQELIYCELQKFEEAFNPIYTIIQSDED